MSRQSRDTAYFRTCRAVRTRLLLACMLTTLLLFPTAPPVPRQSPLWRLIVATQAAVTMSSRLAEKLKKLVRWGSPHAGVGGDATSRALRAMHTPLTAAYSSNYHCDTPSFELHAGPIR